MTTEQFIQQFNPADFLHLGYYPFPDLINEHVEEMGIVECTAIDTDYLHLSEKLREKYKKIELYKVTSRMQPYLTREQMIPCVRFLFLHTVMDDQYEHCTIEELEHLRERTVAILQGGEVLDTENGMFRQLALVRDEFNAFVTKEWMDRFIQDTSDYIQYGIEGETPYRKSNALPPLANYAIIREYAVGMYMHFDFVELGLDYPFSGDIIRHPVIQRIRRLAERLTLWQNDIHSLRKELHNQKETFNTVILLKNELKISLEEAVIECKRIHDADLAEFITLWENLPDFGIHQENIKECVKRIGTVVQGINSFYIQEPTRYTPEGFSWPDIEPLKERVFPEEGKLHL